MEILFSFFCFNLPSAEHFIIFVTFFLVRDLCTHFYVYYFSSSASSASFSPSFLYHRNIIVVAFRALSSLSLHFCVSAACPLCSNPFLCHCLLFLEVSLSVYICSKYHLLKQFNLGKRDMHWFRRWDSPCNLFCVRIFMPLSGTRYWQQWKQSTVAVRIVCMT